MGKIIFEFTKEDDKAHVSVKIEKMEKMGVQEVVAGLFDYTISTLNQIEEDKDMLITCVALNDVFSSKLSAAVAERLKKEKEKKDTK